MFASGGRDYHFYITDASGDGRVVEYDCDDPARPLVDTPAAAATNFYALYPDRVKPNQRNDIYGHGRERYDAVLEVFDHNSTLSADVALRRHWDNIFRFRLTENTATALS